MRAGHVLAAGFGPQQLSPLGNLAHGWKLLGILVGLAVGLYLHNAAQTGAAALLGDKFPRRTGWFAVKPQRQIDPFGAIGAVLAGTGWPSPVPLSTRTRTTSGKLRTVGALLAGPVAYFALACAFLAGAIHAHNEHLLEGLFWAGVVNAGMMIFSLVPVPPLDGGRILFTLAPTSYGWQKARYQLAERNIGVAIALVLLLLPYLLSFPSIVDQLLEPLLRNLLPLLGAT